MRKRRQKLYLKETETVQIVQNIKTQETVQRPLGSQSEYIILWQTRFFFFFFWKRKKDLQDEAKSQEEQCDS